MFFKAVENAWNKSFLGSWCRSQWKPPHTINSERARSPTRLGDLRGNKSLGSASCLLSPQPAPVGEHLLWGLSALCASTPCRPHCPTAKRCCDVPMGDCCLKVIPRGTSWHHSSSSWGTLLQEVLPLPSVVRWWITVIIKKNYQSWSS